MFAAQARLAFGLEFRAAGRRNLVDIGLNE
jgi:hypothetical protein